MQFICTLYSTHLIYFEQFIFDSLKEAFSQLVLLDSGASAWYHLDLLSNTERYYEENYYWDKHDCHHQAAGTHLVLRVHIDSSRRCCTLNWHWILVVKEDASWLSHQLIALVITSELFVIEANLRKFAKKLSAVHLFVFLLIINY